MAPRRASQLAQARSCEASVLAQRLLASIVAELQLDHIARRGGHKRETGKVTGADL